MLGTNTSILDDLTSDYPRRAPLSRARIIEAAVALLDAHGLEALTMRRLGDALSVRAMSIYKHFDNKEEVLQAVGEHLYTEIEDGQSHGCAFEELREVMLALCGMVERRPYMPSLFASRRDPLWTEHSARQVDALVAAGVPRSAALRGVGVMYRIVIGAAYLRDCELGGGRAGFVRFGVDAVINQLRDLAASPGPTE